MPSAIILAAGESRRMGRQKALLPYAGHTVIEHIVRQTLASGFEETLVVLGHDPEPVAQQLLPYPTKLVMNSCYRDGMLSSVRAGLDALDECATSMALFLGDQPQVRAELVRALARQFTSSGRRILVPRFQGRGGHPAFISLDFRSEIMQRYEETGLRGLFQAHRDEVLYVDVADAWILEDMDTPEDYARALEQLAAQEDATGAA